LKLTAPDNAVVYDPFAGSGTTIRVAERMGLTGIGTEIDPAYVDIATRRITDWNTPEHSGTTYEELFE
jgi:DNA modification methylase